MGRELEQTFPPKRCTAAHRRMHDIIIHQENANENHNEIPLHTRHDDYYKKNLKITNIAEVMEKLEPLCTAGRNAN